MSINIYVDIMPLDYYDVNDVWFGLSFLVDRRHPDEGNVVVALRKHQHQNIAGLQVAIGKKLWVMEPNNFDFPLMQWCRMRVEIDKFIPKKSLHLRAKVWKETEPEPEGWMTETEISGTDVSWSGRGISSGTESLWGKGRNPIAAFDNLVIFSGQSHPEIWGLKCKELQV